MATPFEFYFDFSSPYGYFASTQIDALAAEFNRNVRWRPILLGAIFKKTSAAPLTELPLKGNYALRDFARTAALFGIPYSQPARFPIATVGAARAMLWIEQNAGETKAKESAHRVYRAYFAEGQDIDNLGTIKELADKAGIDATLLADAIQQESVKTALRNQIETAMDKGVFGSPFIFIDGEPFWGFDRFDYIRKWLRNETKPKAR
ncbi:MAG TPA: 2-hydroxychromene-2-carboxylate isomerase [Paralcaligenes sp.]